MRVAIIPARGGSKRIPGKNLKAFRGKPIIAYSIETARASGLFDRVVVSTDSEDIASVSREHGAEVPFGRPAELSDDYAGTNPVISHAIEWLSADDRPVELACAIYATAPFLQPDHLAEALEKLLKVEGCEFAFPVTTFAHPIFRALEVGDEGLLRMFWPENEAKRSQEFPEAYHDAGMFYWGTPAAFATHAGTFNARSVPLILPRHLVHDIDTPEDWARAELVYAALSNQV